MKSILLSFILMFCFGISTQSLDQVDQGAKIEKMIRTSFDLGVITSSGQNLLPKLKAQTSSLLSFQKSFSFSSIQVHEFHSLPVLTFNKHSNFISSGASLIYNLSRSHS